MNINEECLLQYLSNPNELQSFVMEMTFNDEKNICSEYNDIKLLFL